MASESCGLPGAWGSSDYRDLGSNLEAKKAGAGDGVALSGSLAERAWDGKRPAESGRPVCWLRGGGRGGGEGKGR